MHAITLPPEAESRLSALAKATGLSKAHFAREAILTYLEDLDDVRVAEERLAAIYAGHSKTIPIEKVMAELGLDV